MSIQLKTLDGTTHLFEGNVHDENSHHYLAVTCWCNPTMGVDSILTHHAERYDGPAGLTSEFPIQVSSHPSVWPPKRPRCRLFHQWGAWSETQPSKATNNTSLDKWFQYRMCWRCKRVERRWID